MILDENTLTSSKIGLFIVIFFLSACAGSGKKTSGSGAPTDLSVTPDSTTELFLTWKDNTDTETGFVIERSVDGLHFANIHETLPDETSWTDTGLNHSTMYYYRVQAKFGDAFSGYSNVASTSTLCDGNTSLRCGDLCVNPNYDKLNCGTCGNDCDDGQVCIEGSCTESPCDPPCQNGGTCSGLNQCECLNGWSGETCEESLCDPPCQNGGTCIGVNQCECLSGWSGVTCEESLCDPPCQNGGTCSGPDQCSCPAGWSGDICNVPNCNPSCQNGGTCIAPNQCTCPNGWTGQTCETVTDAIPIDKIDMAARGVGSEQVLTWPQTAQLNSMNIHWGSWYGAPTWYVDIDAVGHLSWTEYRPYGGPNDVLITGNIWILVPQSGSDRWWAAPFEGLVKFTTIHCAGNLNFERTNILENSPLASPWQPQAGVTYGWMISTNVSTFFPSSNDDQRSNIILETWPPNP
ncbi:fibronectin type III domain-containing protein [Myxococcota bacterium]|nr:fibronectin type III domain-containing protein [Myxococcota bacterium]MBU1381633.1 fibronectin type III domain-containing protein [Myxococcota bacterium]MBU1496823.1 fibronectin type III domain-containing protein [Myxococcota bacterium]